MNSSSPSASATSVVATFSPFHLKGNRDARGHFPSVWCRTVTGTEAPAPEGVPHPVPETYEALLVFSHEVARVEVDVSLGKHVPQQLLLGQAFASGVTEKRADGADLGQQEARLT